MGLEYLSKALHQLPASEVLSASLKCESLLKENSHTSHGLDLEVLLDEQQIQFLIPLELLNLFRTVHGSDMQINAFLGSAAQDLVQLANILATARLGLQQIGSLETAQEVLSSVVVKMLSKVGYFPQEHPHFQSVQRLELSIFPEVLLDGSNGVSEGAVHLRSVAVEGGMVGGRLELTKHDSMAEPIGAVHEHHQPPLGNTQIINIIPVHLQWGHNYFVELPIHGHLQTVKGNRLILQVVQSPLLFLIISLLQYLCVPVSTKQYPSLRTRLSAVEITLATLCLHYFQLQEMHHSLNTGLSASFPLHYTCLPLSSFEFICIGRLVEANQTI